MGKNIHPQHALHEFLVPFLIDTVYKSGFDRTVVWITAWAGQVYSECLLASWQSPVGEGKRCSQAWLAGLPIENDDLLYNYAENVVPFSSAQYKVVMDGNLAVFVKRRGWDDSSGIDFELCFFLQDFKKIWKKCMLSYIFSVWQLIFSSSLCRLSLSFLALWVSAFYSKNIVPGKE